MLKRPDLSGEDKLAWRYLYRKTRGGRERVPLTASELSDDQGKTTDTGRTRRKNLEKARLLRVIDEDRLRGVWLVELADAFEAFQAVRPNEYDPQRVLFDESETDAPQAPSAKPTDGSSDAPACVAFRPPAEEPPEVPPEEPRSARAELPLRAWGPSEPSEPSEPSTDLDFNQPSTIGSPSEPYPASASSTKDCAPGGDRGTSGGSSAADEARFLAEVERRRGQVAEPKSAETLAAEGVTRRLVEEASVRQQAAARERWIGIIERRVADEGLRDCVKVRIACHLADGSLPIPEVETVLRCLDKAALKGTLRGSRGAYFVVSMQRVFKERGLPWPKPKPK